MQSPADELQDSGRLAALAETGLLDSAAEETFDRLTRMVSKLLGVPVALVSLVDDDRQFFKSQHGLQEPYSTSRETPLSHSFCQHVVIGRAPLVVSDAENDPRVCDNLAIPDLGVKAYLGVPLTLPSGHVIGSLCAVDTRPHPWSDADLKWMTDIADIVMNEISLRREIAQRQLAEQSQALLIDELHHRVKNTLATVQALIRLNLAAAPTLEAFRDTIGARIASLAKTHSLLKLKHWRVIAFRDLLNSELEAYQRQQHVVFDGPDFDMPAERATILGMVIHELATNAAKYGALSAPGGHIDIHWSVAPVAGQASATITLTWRESGGPLVAQQRQMGFGSSLIERLIAQLRGTASFDFATTGLIFRASVNLPVIS
ncbi:hypothetical protein OO17_25905 [Rhodopseudomonas palustris]|uniref:histidine kinase n=1 Tax=Rhodopseudomonas palustris TaxID=1076 RepID=A0A0D7E349_RHOPL|nr:hypothetical protein OO17_25905 [Rhodopseudomonas palustris]